MGTAVGDVDGNGMIDWYVTAIYDDEASGRGDGNKLYLNQGGHTFDEVAAGMGVDDGGWGWGALVADINLDGRLDIVEVNGWPFPVYTDEMAKLVDRSGGWDVHRRSGRCGARSQLDGTVAARSRLRRGWGP